MRLDIDPDYWLLICCDPFSGRSDQVAVVCLCLFTDE